MWYRYGQQVSSDHRPRALRLTFRLLEKINVWVVKRKISYFKCCTIILLGMLDFEKPLHFILSVTYRIILSFHIICNYNKNQNSKLKWTSSSHIRQKLNHNPLILKFKTLFFLFRQQRIVLFYHPIYLQL